MVNTRFEAYKIKRELLRSGMRLSFWRPKLNTFKEPQQGEPDLVGTVVGLYHEQNAYVKLSADQNSATQYRSKKVPMILCLYQDVAPLKLQTGDIVDINSRTFKVTGVTNIQEWNMIVDVSLEVDGSGIHA